MITTPASTRLNRCDLLRPSRTRAGALDSPGGLSLDIGTGEPGIRRGRLFNRSRLSVQHDHVLAGVPATSSAMPRGSPGSTSEGQCCPPRPRARLAGFSCVAAHMCEYDHLQRITPAKHRPFGTARRCPSPVWSEEPATASCFRAPVRLREGAPTRAVRLRGHRHERDSRVRARLRYAAG